MNKRTFAALTLFAATGIAHAGSGISVAAEATGHVTCPNVTSATAAIDVAVTAGSAAPFTLFASTGGDFANLGTFPDWATYGRTKAAEVAIQVTVPASVPAQLTICVAQPGNRQACTAVSLPAMCGQSSGTDYL